MKPHKHAELIKAWADGAEIQAYNAAHDEWRDIDEHGPVWHPFTQYRIKPQPNPETESKPTKMAIVYNKYQHRYEIGLPGTYWNREQFDLIGYFEVIK